MNAFGAESIEIKPGSACFLVGAQIKQNKYKTLQDSWTVDDSLDELGRLCDTAGLEVRGRDYQTMQHPSASTFVGPGKLEEIAEVVKRMRVEVVVFDEELSPAQGRNCQDVLGKDVQVVDRTMLILTIFAQRARTGEAKLQVQAAQMNYMLPRLKTFLSVGAGLDSKGGGASSGGGGQFLKGSGESQLEVDRRLFRKQLSKIQADLAAVQSQRDAYRAKRREREALPVIAIVGYTNAGKSTLLNTLCGST
jgi:GTP-binding protein HflX